MRGGQSGQVGRRFWDAAPLVMLWAAGLWATSSRAWAATLSWVERSEEVSPRAAELNRPVLLLLLGGDFTGSAGESREARLFDLVTLRDAELREWLDAHFVVHRRVVGPPAAERQLSPRARRAAGAEPPPTGGSVICFCMPRGRLLHFCVGYPSPDVLRREATWAETAFRQLTALERGVAEQAAVLRKLHLEELGAGTQFGASGRSLWSDGQLARPVEAATIRSVIDAGLEGEALVLRRRFGGTWQGAARQRRLTELIMAHGLGAECAHWVMSELPLMPLDWMERPLFEQLTGRSYWRVSARRQTLLAWFREAYRNRPRLLIVATGERVAAVEAAEPGPAGQEFKFDELNRLLPDFAVLQLSLAELAAMATDAKLERLSWGVKQPPRYVVVNAAGEVVAGGLLADRRPLSDLVEAMRRAVPGNPR